MLAALPVAARRRSPPSWCAASTSTTTRIDELHPRASPQDWTLERMPAVDRALLRLGAYELGHRPDVPTARRCITEAVELAKRYSTEDSGRFVNGLLATIAAEVRP